MTDCNVEDSSFSSVSVKSFKRKETDENGVITIKRSSVKLEATINEQDSVEQITQVLAAVQDWLNSVKASLPN